MRDRLRFTGVAGAPWICRANPDDRPPNLRDELEARASRRCRLTVFFSCNYNKAAKAAVSHRTPSACLHPAEGQGEAESERVDGKEVDAG